MIYGDDDESRYTPNPITSRQQALELELGRLLEKNNELERLRDKNNIIDVKFYKALLKDLDKEKKLKEAYAIDKAAFDDLEADYEELWADYRKLKKREDKRKRAGRKPFTDRRTIKRIYTLYIIKGCSLQEIADKLNKTLSSKKTNWAKSTIRYILLNPENVERGIVSESIFKDLKKIMESRRNVKNKEPKVSFRLLS